MFKISFPLMIIIISLIYLVTRATCCIIKGRIDTRREALLSLVYICIAVIARFTLYPFETVSEPLVFNVSRIFPLNLNLIPFVNILKHDSAAKAALNICGNIAMFIPVGVIWPLVFKELSTPLPAIAAGAGFSLFIELIQLPFRSRVTDIDDVILNTLGFVIGYVIYLCVSRAVMKKRNQQPSEAKQG